MDWGKLLTIAVGTILVNNFVLARFLGLCPFLGCTKQLDAAAGMGMAVIFVMTMTAIVTFGVNTYILAPLGLEFLRTVAFILVIASLVQFVEMVIEKSSPRLYRVLGIYLPLVTTNCAVLGVAVINMDKSYNFAQATVHGFTAGIGFTLVLLLMASLRERIEMGEVPESLRGMPLGFIITGLMAIAFLGFSGLVTE